jgi:hypothetical protein
MGMKRIINKIYGWMEHNPFTVALVSGGMSAAAVLAVASLAIYSDQAYVQKTPCTRDATSEACAKIREKVARAEPIRNPCISFQRVTATRGRNCPRDFVWPKHQRQASSKEVQNSEQDAEQTREPAPSNGTGGRKPPKGGNDGGSAPQHPGGQAPVAAPSPGSSGEQNPVSSTPAPGGAAPSGASPLPEPIAEPAPVTSTLEQTHEAVHELACPLTERLLGICPS